MATDAPTGWYSRGYLPHLNTPGLVQFITFHLADSMPRATLYRLMDETEHDEAERYRRLERLLDAGHGACWLRRLDIGRLVENALFSGDGTAYRLLSWVVMPNHVHALIETQPSAALASVVKGWKGASARQANQVLKRQGRFWERDYYDRFIRDDEHLSAVLRYIEQNPVKAGLAQRCSEWPLGSARFAHSGGDAD